MKTFVALMVLIACVWADVSSVHHHDTSSSSSSSSTSSSHTPHSYPQPAPAATPDASAAPTKPYGDSHQTNGAPVDPNGYYYYYYPVQQEQQQTKGLFDFRKDGDLFTVICIGTIVVGALLLGVAYFDTTTEARTLDIPYDHLYHLAKKVYRAISKKY